MKSSKTSRMPRKKLGIRILLERSGVALKRHLRESVNFARLS
jgi:hypothetical protein